jgi:hypothetical protein
MRRHYYRQPRLSELFWAVLLVTAGVVAVYWLDLRVFAGNLPVTVLVVCAVVVLIAIAVRRADRVPPLPPTRRTPPEPSPVPVRPRPRPRSRAGHGRH